MASEPARGGRAYRLTVAGLVVVLALIVFLNSWGVFTADIKPEIYLAPQAMFDEYLSAWTFSPYLGGPNFNTGLAPIVAVVAALRGAGLSPEMAFKVFHLLLWVVAAWGMVRLVRRLEQRIAPVLSLVAGVAYIANPYAVSAGSTLAILLPMAILPWQLLVLLRSFEDRRWRWPALFGLTFFLMSGANAGVVPVFGLLAAIPVALHARRRLGLRWWTIVATLARCAFFVVLLSAYWLIPALSAESAGTSVVANSESAEAIAGVSSFSEVLRGLGLWPLYGRDATGPWTPGHAMYLTSTVVVLATFVVSAWAVLALGSVPRRVARLLTSLVVIAVVVMVGTYPVGSPSPFGRFLATLFDAVPALAAFRTTNKIGAVLCVALALAVTLALRGFFRRNHPRTPTGAAGLAGLMVLTVLVSLPAWTGKLYTSEVSIPGYWEQAARTIDDAPDDRRVLALPGQVSASYRWSQSRPDDIFNSLFTRDVVVPITTPSTSRTAFNFGAALDGTFQSGVAAPGSTSAYARYLGADAVLLRHDVNWEDSGGARPSQTQRTVNADPGLTPVRNFGRPGENVGSPTVPPDGFTETAVPPLQLYGVNGPRSMVRTEPQRGSLIVAGDGWSVDQLAGASLLSDGPAFRYAPDLSDRQWEQSLTEGSRIVLTDTNRRRDAIANRLTNGQGPLLAAADVLPATSRTLGDDPDDQTVLAVTGGRATASQSGLAFYDLPWGVPDNAFDNDPQTSWIFGDFDRAVGQTLDLDLPAPRAVGSIRITQADRGPVRIKTMTVTGGGEKQTVTFGPDGTASLDLDAASASALRFRVTALTGDGFNPVGIQDISIAGVDLTRVARTPTTIDRRYDAMDAASRARFRLTPLDVLLSRAQGTAAADDDEEAGLERDFSIPDARSFDVQGTVRVDDVREDVYDRLAGIPAGATSSSRAFDNPDLRASQAFDRHSGTAWIPDNPVAGEWIQLTGPRRELAELKLDQRAVAGATSTNWATRISVVADGRTLTTQDVEPGTNTIDLTTDGIAPTVGTVRVVIDASVDPTGTASPPRIREIGAGLRLRADASAARCVKVAELDGKALRMRPTVGASSDGSAWELCGRDVDLTAGTHRLRSTDPTVTIDSLNLLDDQDVSSRGGRAVSPRLTADRGFGASMTVRTEASPDGAPYFLTIGQAYDPRWHAEVAGRDLGAPVVVDGYATGWLITSAEAQTVHVTYGPQTSTNAAIVATLTGLGLVTLILLVAAARARFVRVERLLAAMARRRRSLTDRVPRLGGRLRGLGLRVRWPAGHGLRAARARRIARWTAFALGAFVFASWPGLVAVAIAAAWHAYRPPSSVVLIRTGAALILLAGLLFIVGMGENRGTVAVALVSDNPWPNRATVCGLVLAIVGVWRTGPADGERERLSTRG